MATVIRWCRRECDCNCRVVNKSLAAASGKCDDAVTSHSAGVCNLFCQQRQTYFTLKIKSNTAHQVSHRATRVCFVLLQCLVYLRWPTQNTTRKKMILVLLGLTCGRQRGATGLSNCWKKRKGEEELYKKLGSTLVYLRPTLCFVSNNLVTFIVVIEFPEYHFRISR